MRRQKSGAYDLRSNHQLFRSGSFEAYRDRLGLIRHQGGACTRNGDAICKHPPHFAAMGTWVAFSGRSGAQCTDITPRLMRHLRCALAEVCLVQRHTVEN